MSCCLPPVTCRCLARGLALTETLVVLELSNNGLDDDKLRMLASGLADNISVTHLNLSHNRISDRCGRGKQHAACCSAVNDWRGATAATATALLTGGRSGLHQLSSSAYVIAQPA
jgi:hypothetical protein